MWRPVALAWVACLAMLCSQAVESGAPPYLRNSGFVRGQRRAETVPGLWDPTWTAPADCLPLRSYTAAETTAWLSSNSFNVSQTYAGKLDGATLVDLIDGTLQTDLVQMSIVPLSQLSRLVTAVKNTKSEPYLALPPSLDPCSRLYDPDGGKGSVVEVSAVVEKVLEFDTEGYTFEVILNIGFLWEEDRTGLLPVATPDEMEACPVSQRCGTCFFQGTETCEPRNGNTDPRHPLTAAGVNKCCTSLWNPINEDPFAGVFFPNAKETEILNQEGPSYYEMPVYAIAYSFLRMRGVFYVPMEFKEYPYDESKLDIHMTTKAPMSFFNMSNISINPNATAYYVAGGPLMPKPLKEELDLLGESGCPFDASDGNSKAPSKKNFEDLSGFTISKKVDVLQLKQDTEDCMWYSPCNTTWPTKFPLMVNWLRALGVDPFAPNQEIPYAPGNSFIVFRMTVCRRPQYYLDNVFWVVLLLNVVNVLSLLLSPKEIDTRLASCGTMVLALMVLQQFVADSTPKAGYATDGQRFVKVSNFLMIAAGAWSVLAYQACERNYSLLRHFVRSWDPAGVVIEYEWMMWDHVFMIILFIILFAQVDEIFHGRPGLLDQGTMLTPSLVVGVILIVMVTSVWITFLRRWVGEADVDNAVTDSASQGRDSRENKPRTLSKVAPLSPGQTSDLTVTDVSSS